MSSAQVGSHGGTQDAQSREHPSTRPQQTHTTPANPRAPEDDPIEVDDETCISPQVRALLEQAAEATGLEVDDDGDDEAEAAGEEDEEDENAGSVYAMSMYPGVRPVYHVEDLSENGHDEITIGSAQSLYAEDFDFVVENGRLYCGDYFVPVDGDEQTRQHLAHQAYLQLMDLELTTVPLDNPRYILDIGTGGGEWAVAIAEKYEDCEVYGTDIAPIQETGVPKNVEFHIEDAEDEWIRPADTFDLVHLRNMEGAFSDWPYIYNQAFACIKPGGWIEVMDWEDFFAEKNYLSFFPDESAPHVLTKAVLEAAELAGKPRDGRHLSKDLLVEAGFVDIQEHVYDVGIGSRENSSYGTLWLLAILHGLEPGCLRLLTKYLRWDAEDVRELCGEVARLTKEVAQDPARVEAFVVKLRVVAGRKPVAPGQWTAMTLNGNGDINDYSGGESTVGARTVHSEETA